MIPVTKPFLPPQNEYQEYLDGIWKREWLTNMGPLANELELKLKKHLGVQHLLYVTNGTVAIQLAIKALEIQGDIITTPFSFVATSSSIVWEGCNPIYVDIDPETLTIDATKIESAITPNTKAILATHVYGNPCDVYAIDKIAKKHNLKVIYDAAHAFGVKVNGKSIFEFGDISTCSLHATKLYHSIEGGLIVTNSAELTKKMAYMRNFGISGYESFSELGINGKNSEFHAGMGILNLKYIDDILEKRKLLCERYDSFLKKSSRIQFVKWNNNSIPNYAYYTILFENENILLDIVKELEMRKVATRRYFYPSLSTALPYLTPQLCPVADEISKRVLCLPLYYDLDNEVVNMICRLILRYLNN